MAAPRLQQADLPEGGRDIATDSDSDDEPQADHPEYFGRGWRPAGAAADAAGESVVDGSPGPSTAGGES